MYKTRLDSFSLFSCKKLGLCLCSFLRPKSVFCYVISAILGCVNAHFDINVYKRNKTDKNVRLRSAILSTQVCRGSINAESNLNNLSV